MTSNVQHEAQIDIHIYLLAVIKRRSANKIFSQRKIYCAHVTLSQDMQHEGGNVVLTI